MDKITTAGSARCGFPTLLILIPTCIPYAMYCLAMLLEKVGVQMASHGNGVAEEMLRGALVISIVFSFVVECGALTIALGRWLAWPEERTLVNAATFVFGLVATPAFYIVANCPDRGSKCTGTLDATEAANRIARRPAELLQQHWPEGQARPSSLEGQAAERRPRHEFRAVVMTAESTAPMTRRSDDSKATGDRNGYFWQRSLAVMLLIAFGLNATSAVASPERVSFPKGEFGTQLRGAVRGFGFKDYLVQARKGQHLSATIESANSYMVFRIISINGQPDETLMPMESDEFSGTLPKSGDYVIRAFMLRAGARKKGASANYELRIEIGDATR